MTSSVIAKIENKVCGQKIAVTATREQKSIPKDLGEKITAISKADKLKITVKLANIAIARFEVKL